MWQPTRQTVSAIQAFQTRSALEVTGLIEPDRRDVDKTARRRR